MSCEPLAPPSIAALAVDDLKLLKRSTTNRAIFDGSATVYQPLMDWYFSLQSKAVRLGVPLRAIQGYRSDVEQDRAFRRGASNARAGQSPHNHGYALDIIHMTRAWKHMSVNDWLLLGTFGKEIARQRNLKITWGGDWGSDWDASPPKRGWDCAHWEVANWRELPSLTR